uniref:Uncharacterized protein n=1 Tax=Arcella intermedia TaxID=1963864 RepID=A0A6B2LJJ7_9EUKA
MQVKCVLVGDSKVGKTSLLYVYTHLSFPTEYLPRFMDTFTINAVINNQIIHLTLWDTVGEEQYDALRPLAYPQTDVFLCVFSVVHPSSYNHILTKWVPELSHLFLPAPMVLVGTQVDLRDDLEVVAQKGNAPITYEKGLELSTTINAVKYLECSSLHNQGVKEVFEEAAKAFLGTLPEKPQVHKKAGGCVLL